MNRKIYNLIKNIEGVISDKESYNKFKECVTELDAHYDSCLSGISEELEPEAYKYTSDMSNFVSSLLEAVNNENIEKPLFNARITKEYLDKLEIDPNNITKLSFYVDILCSFSEGLSCDITLWDSENNDYMDYDGLEASLTEYKENDNLYYLDTYVRRGGTITYRDLFTYIDEDILKIFLRNNIIVESYDRDETIKTPIQSLDLDSYITIGVSYDT